MEGREILFNHRTPLHSDKSDPKAGLATLQAVGDFEGGRMRVPGINTTSQYNPGDLILLRSNILKHEVLDFTGCQRICVAHFTHRSLWQRYGIETPLTIHKT